MPIATAADVSIPAPGVALRAAYAMPAGPVTAPAIVALHGCGGPFPARDGQWRDVFTASGHPVLLPDSFGSRGLGSQCKNPTRGITPNGGRRTDTVAAVQWLAAQPTTPPGGVVVVGWSNGGSTVLAAAAEGVMPPGLVRGFVAFYPGCRIYAQKPGWAPSAPMLIIMGEDDDWTPAAPCRELAARFPDRIKLVLIPGAYHDFDAPGRPVIIRSGLAYTAGRDGNAHVGTNEAGRQQALRDVPAWISALPPLR
jgi:dienelactone hydrolase